MLYVFMYARKFSEYDGRSRSNSGRPRARPPRSTCGSRITGYAASESTAHLATDVVSRSAGGPIFMWSSVSNSRRG